MRLRNICTGHTRIPRRTLRLALALALATSGWSPLLADSPLPHMPRPMPNAVTESELLPYPFGQTGVPRASNSHDVAASRAGVSSQLVKLLGLTRPVQLAELNGQTGRSNPLTVPVPLPSLALPVSSTSPSVPHGGVVSASATEEQQSAAALPTLPSNTAATEISLSESLLDIEIPSELTFTSPDKRSNGSADQSAAMPSLPQPTPCADACATAPDQLLGIVPCEPPSLNFSDAVMTKSSVPVKGKQPDIVRSPKAMSLAGKPAAATKEMGAVSMNLSDSEPAVDSRNAGSASGRGTVLHLSSGSDTIALTAPVASSKMPSTTTAPRIQIRVEGESAPVIREMGDLSGPMVRAAAPLPMLEPSPAAEPSPLLTTTARTLSPVKAVLASRTTPVVSPSSRPTSTSARVPASTLTVGLQESQTLSTDYSIFELSVEHPNICQLLKTSDRSVSVIGMRPGTTRIALISYDSQGERSVDVRDVAVGESAPTAVNLPELAKEISQTVARMYPKSDVQIIAYQDYVMVRGYTNYESDAKKILALVRKTSLAPVVDQLTTSGN